MRSRSVPDDRIRNHLKTWFVKAVWVVVAIIILEMVVVLAAEEIKPFERCHRCVAADRGVHIACNGWMVPTNRTCPDCSTEWRTNRSHFLGFFAR